MDQTAWPATRHETRGAAHEPDAGTQIKGQAYTPAPLLLSVVIHQISIHNRINAPG